jgi:hypothetical protein
LIGSGKLKIKNLLMSMLNIREEPRVGLLDKRGMFRILIEMKEISVRLIN